ncbi:hypothetical protein [Nocardiopsis halotolerans]|uniref:hypothetical protein n=1 Tax=Nocardiopsis halotolerans TaxID=124252 RepID=UPI00034C6678|nr:hypothetical protein [Nocardiopsis halotolerans]
MFQLIVFATGALLGVFIIVTGVRHQARTRKVVERWRAGDLTELEATSDWLALLLRLHRTVIVTMLAIAVLVGVVVAHASVVDVWDDTTTYQVFVLMLVLMTSVWWRGSLHGRIDSFRARVRELS